MTSVVEYQFLVYKIRMNIAYKQSIDQYTY
jgi:hypothetical protein